MVSKSLVIIGVMLILSFSAVSAVAFTVRAPILSISDHEPAEPIVCPPVQLDADCVSDGIGLSSSYHEALGAAVNECILIKGTCKIGQTNEYIHNRNFCEQVPGCTLKYQVVIDECEIGGPANCNPPPGSGEDPSTTIYVCKIHGGYNVTNYRCDTEPSSEGEIITT